MGVDLDWSAWRLQVVSALEGQQEAPSAVHSLGARWLGSLPAELPATQGATQPLVRSLVFLIKRSNVISTHGSQREEEHLSVQTPLYLGRAWLLGNGFQEEGDSLVYLVHANPAQHFLQEGQGEGVVVPPPAVVPHGYATVYPPQDVEGGPVVCVRGQCVPQQPHPHC